MLLLSHFHLFEVQTGACNQNRGDAMDLLILHIVGLHDSLFCKAARVGGARLKRNGQRLWVSAKLFLVVADLA